MTGNVVEIQASSVSHASRFTMAERDAWVRTICEAGRAGRPAEDNVSDSTWNRIPTLYLESPRFKSRSDKLDIFQ